MERPRLSAFLRSRLCIASANRAVWRLSFAVVCAAILLATAPPTFSSPSSSLSACAISTYGHMEAVLAFNPGECDVVHEVVVLSEEGTRDIRLTYDASIVDVAAPMLLREFERALYAAPAALQKLGAFRLDPVRVSITAETTDESAVQPTQVSLDVGEGATAGTQRRDVPSPPAQPLGLHAMASRGHAPDLFADIVGTTSLSEGECRVHLHVLSPDARVESAAPVFLHELFHCVQLATLDAELTRSGSDGRGSGGDWWIEGSAEWFTALALPEADLLQQRLARFDRVSADTPLHQMSYEAVVFFLWLGSARQPWAIIPFLKRMALQPDAAAQTQAMTNALSLEGWMEFARHYLEGRIAHPHGTPVNCGPPAGEQAVGFEGVASIELEPFVLYRGWYETTCSAMAPELESTGHQSVHRLLTSDAALERDVALTPDGTHTVDGALNRGDPSQTNNAPPGKAATREQFQFMGLAAAAEPVFLQLEAALKNGCRPCQGAAAIDACLVGVSF